MGCGTAIITFCVLSIPVFILMAVFNMSGTVPFLVTLGIVGLVVFGSIAYLHKDD